jgi:CDP-glucose 4,6-dehydratase
VSSNADFWRGRRVFVTGHTGFKAVGSLCLHHLAASVHGFALDPPTTPSLFETARIKSLLASDTRADLADLARLKSSLDAAQPEVVFHLAAQSLVRESYHDPRHAGHQHHGDRARVLESGAGVGVGPRHRADHDRQGV